MIQGCIIASHYLICPLSCALFCRGVELLSLKSHLLSSPRRPSTQWSHRDPGHGHVDFGWTVDLRNYHQFLNVFPRTGRVLNAGVLRVSLGGSAEPYDFYKPHQFAFMTTFVLRPSVFNSCTIYFE